MKYIVIDRIKQNDYQTIGYLSLFDHTGKELFRCKTLELPWKDNQRNISRIPSGEYAGQSHISPRFGKCLWVKGVPERSEILIHVGNYNRDTRGCILVGKNFIDIDGDGNKDVTHSRDTINNLYGLINNNDLIGIYINDNL